MNLIFLSRDFIKLGVCLESRKAKTNCEKDNEYNELMKISDRDIWKPLKRTELFLAIRNRFKHSLL
jgi:hypothetical protein